MTCRAAVAIVRRPLCPLSAAAIRLEDAAKMKVQTGFPTVALPVESCAEMLRALATDCWTAAAMEPVESAVMASCVRPEKDSLTSTLRAPAVGASVLTVVGLKVGGGLELQAVAPLLLTV